MSFFCVSLQSLVKKYLFFIIFFIVITFTYNNINVYVEKTKDNPSVLIEQQKKKFYTSVDSLYAKHALLMDADNGRVLYEKDGYTKSPMASTTKIMTLLIAF